MFYSAFTMLREKKELIILEAPWNLNHIAHLPGNSCIQFSLIFHTLMSMKSGMEHLVYCIIK